MSTTDEFSVLPGQVGFCLIEKNSNNDVVLKAKPDVVEEQKVIDSTSEDDKTGITVEIEEDDDGKMEIEITVDPKARVALDEIRNEIEKKGGMFKDAAISLESAAPGILGSIGLTANAFTTLPSKVFYEETKKAIQDTIDRSKPVYSAPGRFWK